MPDPAVAFCVYDHEQPALEVRVNFGIFAGRNASPAEIDDLARALRVEVPSFAVVAEERHEFGGAVETSLHQVVVEVAREDAGDDPGELCDRLVAAAERWAEACFASRHLDL